MQIDHRYARTQRPPDEAADAEHRNSGEESNVGVVEPIVLLALVQHVLHCTKADREQRKSNPIELEGTRLDRIAQIVPDQCCRDDADRQIDEERPAPREIVGNPATEHRPERRTDDHTHCEDPLRQALLFERVRIAQNRLRGGDQATSAEALNDAPEDRRSKARREAAHQRGDREDDDRGKEVLTPAESRGEPGRDRNHHDIGNDVSGDDPRTLIDRHAEVSLNVRQCNIHDRRVDDLKQGRSNDRDAHDGPT